MIRVHSICFHKKVLSEVYLYICSIHKKQTFSGKSGEIIAKTVHAGKFFTNFVIY